MTPTEGGRQRSRVEALEQAVTGHITHALARNVTAAKPRDFYLATAWSARDRLAKYWAATQDAYRREGTKRVYYLSLEFLMGRMLGNALLNLGIEDPMGVALEELGVQLEELQELEPDAALGNGGLGRLAACYLDSMATQGIPGYGYGIRYEFGMFRQRIEDGWQKEMPENWLADLNPWQLVRPDRTYTVQFFGRVTSSVDADGRQHFQWVGTQDVLAVACDYPVPGYRNRTVNTLRLWTARATEEFDLSYFIRSDYSAALQAKIQSEAISKVLYPPDDTSAGKELRLKQQHFFVSATLQDLIRRHQADGQTLGNLPERAQIQMNDTHPALAVPELMRLLMDEHGFEWDAAWHIVTGTLAYTNHTVLPEALETWSIDLLGRLLPRHLDIIREIDRRFRQLVETSFPDEPERVERMGIVGNGVVRMAHLAIVGSHMVNGVAELHGRIIRERVFADFHDLWPDRFTHVTNGVTPRRWIMKANPGQTALMNSRLGDDWACDLERLRELAPAADDAEFREHWREVKHWNKVALAEIIRRETGEAVDPVTMMFDVQVKRMHEYKRQLLNALRVADLYLRLRDDREMDVLPRAVIFGGKAAPTYQVAKRIIRLITALGQVCNNDRRVKDKLQVIFLPDYRVSLAERIFPGSDLSEQISTAGYEASGTGNMKFALNGALTIGTLDGATVEIAERVGRDNIFLFGLTAEQVEAKKREGYRPWEYAEASPRLKRVLEFLISGDLPPHDPDTYRPLVDDLLSRDPYLLLADFDAYLEAQDRVDAVYRDPEEWTRRAIINVASCGYFSSDRSVRDYAERIWRL
ncbi:MAG TPA: glycogen/starch/alpha-glucan phosphorylase [Longimicrobiales bacterium]|nr:glycogen/starch/alpha-glucan phosphorylase [Longimicrobiales bacterium]